MSVSHTLSAAAVRRPHARAALLRAFADLIQIQRYEEIRVADIIRQAQVGRSTFYENFRGKEGLLTSSIAGPFSVLASSFQPQTKPTALIELLEHFWLHRALARSLLFGSVRHKTIAVLVIQVEHQLKSYSRNKTLRFLIPRRLTAIQIAEVLIAPVAAWLTGDTRCTAAALSRVLPRAARAVLAASLTEQS